MNTIRQRTGWLAAGFGLCLAAVFVFFTGVLATTEYFRSEWRTKRALLDAETIAVEVTHAQLKRELKNRNVVAAPGTARRKPRLAIGGSEQP